VRTPKTWKAMLAKLAGTGLKLSDDYAMKRPPRGFEGVEDAEIAAVLRLNSLICRRPIPDERLGTPALIADLETFAGDALPLLQFGWSAVIDSR